MDVGFASFYLYGGISLDAVHLGGSGIGDFSFGIAMDRHGETRPYIGLNVHF